MEIEFHHLDLRYEQLRSRSPRRERQLLASLAESGQQLPIVVLSGGEGGRYVVIDGYKRIRALRQLRQDTVRATLWQVEEAEALLLERLMRTSAVEGSLEQGWLLKELASRFSLTQEELARRFDKSPSWVSRRLALVEELPMGIQERVRSGQIVAHAAMKYLVPMARANSTAAQRLAAAIAPLGLATREVGALYAGWLAGDEKTRELIVTQPRLYLRAQQQLRKDQAERSPCEQLLADLDALGGAARRARQRLARGLWGRLGSAERTEALAGFRQARADWIGLWTRFEKEAGDARPEHQDRDPQTT